MYNYTAKLVKVIDGDTLDVIIDIGFHMTTTQRLRLLGIDCPEMNSTDPVQRELAIKAKLRVFDFLYGIDYFEVSTYKSDSFGRYLAEVHIGKGRTLNQVLLDEGLAVEYKR